MHEFPNFNLRAYSLLLTAPRLHLANTKVPVSYMLGGCEQVYISPARIARNLLDSWRPMSFELSALIRLPYSLVPKINARRGIVPTNIDLRICADVGEGF